MLIAILVILILASAVNFVTLCLVWDAVKKATVDIIRVANSNTEEALTMVFNMDTVKSRAAEADGQPVEVGDILGE